MWTWQLLGGAELKGSTLGPRFGMIWDTGIPRPGRTRSWRALPAPDLEWPLRCHLRKWLFPACGLGLELVLSARNLLVGNLRGGSRGDFLLYRQGKEGLVTCGRRLLLWKVGQMGTRKVRVRGGALPTDAWGALDPVTFPPSIKFIVPRDWGGV